jgi:hypothetical protein
LSDNSLTQVKRFHASCVLRPGRSWTNFPGPFEMAVISDICRVPGDSRNERIACFESTGRNP